jgi:hypothetical protein
MLTRKLKKLRSLEPKIVIALLIVVFATVVATVAYCQFNYAKAFEVSGTFVEIQPKTENHQLPKYVILNDARKMIEITHFTVALDPSMIKLGDKIVKEKGDDFCTINGAKVRFSFY